MVIHRRVLGENYLMNTHMTGLIWFSKNICVLVRWMKVALAFEGLSMIIGVFGLFIAYDAARTKSSCA